MPVNLATLRFAFVIPKARLYENVSPGIRNFLRLAICYPPHLPHAVRPCASASLSVIGILVYVPSSRFSVLHVSL